MTNLEFKVIMDVFDIKKEEINEDNEYNFCDHKITYYPDGSVLVEHIQHEIEKKKSTKHSCVNQGWFVNKKEDLVTVIYELQKSYSKDLSNIDGENKPIYVQNMEKDVYENVYKGNLTCIHGCEARIKFTERKNGKRKQGNCNRSGSA